MESDLIRKALSGTIVPHTAGSMQALDAGTVIFTVDYAFYFYGQT
jgi:hypothetical protein